MARDSHSEANRERLERLRNPDKYADAPAPAAVKPGTLEQRITRRPPRIDPQRRIRLQRLVRPPRPVSLALWLRTVLGGWIQQFGWLFFGFGLIFFWAFGMHADIGWPLLAGNTATVQGQVSGWRETGASENEVAIHATGYRYIVDGHEYRGESYAPGSHKPSGLTVMVEYSRSNPELSKISGMRRKQFSAWALFVVIFPALGLAFVIAGMRYGLRAARLLRTGQVAYGKLIDKSATNTRINKQPVYKLTYEFKTPSGAVMQAEARSHVTEALEDEAEEPLLYDPVDPERAVLLDGIPGHPRVGKDGRMRLGSVTGLLSVLVLPLLTLLGHGSYILFGLM